MPEWTIGSINDVRPQQAELFLVLGLDDLPSGDPRGEEFAPFREAVKASLDAQTAGDLKGGEWVHAAPSRAWVQLVGEKPGLDTDERLRLAVAEAFRAAIARKSERVVLLADAFSVHQLSVALEGWWLSSYRLESWKSKPALALPVLHLAVADALVSQASEALARAVRILEATDWVRDRVNEPGSDLPPRIFSEKIGKILSETGISWKASGRKELEEGGYQGLVTVGKGSDHEPVLGVATYRPQDAKPGVHLVLVGKGITFDTGGISIKPSDHMWEMKNDMAGAATALGALVAIARLKLPLTVSTVVCLAENRPGNGSVLPGDIFRAKNGKSVMVDNTDAEGRLVLTDGLWEAGALGATHVVDLATLTGAVVRALGSSVAGILSNDETFSQTIVRTGRELGEKFWPLPLEEEYRAKLDDPLADLRNSGGPEAGTITAALFLREFAPDNAKWAHLDIAGTAFCTKAWKYLPEGATAFGLRTLVDLARRLAGVV